MTLCDVFNQFTYASKINFPIKECVYQDRIEPHVFIADTKYLCLVIDRRFKHEIRILVMYPYIFKEDDGVRYGWCDWATEQPFGNIENSVILWNEFVVGFTEYREIEQEDKLWDYFIQSINAQYEN